MRNATLYSLIVLISLVSICEANNSDFIYAVRDNQQNFAGLNVTEIHFWDFYNTSIASYEFYNASTVRLPDIAKIERELIPGSKAHYAIYSTSRTNETLRNFANTFAVYDKGKELDLRISLISNGLPIVIKLKNDKIEDYISKYPDSLQGVTFDSLLQTIEYGYAFNDTGWARVEYNGTAKRFDVEDNCGFNLGSNIVQTIKMNSIYLSSFRINNSSITCGLPEDLREMQPGYYSLIVLGVNDYGNPILKLLVPFVVLNGTSSSNKPTVSDVVSGKDLSIRFREEFNASFAVLVKNVQYDASVRMDLTKKLSESFNVNLSYGAEKLEEIKIMDKNVNFYAPGKMVRAVFNNSEKFQNISTKNLETGSYILYIFAFGDNLEPRYFGCLSVNILAKATILINSSPPEADVYINGSYVGKTNLTVQLDPGTYEIRITKSGYQNYTTTLTLSSGESRVLNVLLVPIPTAPAILPIVGGGGGGGGGGVIPGVPLYMSDYIKLKANKETEFILPQSAFWETNIVSITFISKDDTTIRFRVEKLKEMPPIPKPFGIVVLMFSIDLTSSVPTEIAGYIVYGVERDIIKEKKFDPDGVLVVIHRFDGENWIKCDTTFLYTDGKYNYYKARVPGFSYFAGIISFLPPTPVETPEKTPGPVKTTPATPSPPTPISFEVYLAVFLLIAIGAILLVVAYMVWKTK
jgi:PGF-pre-PGF domain-containing protein